MPGTERLLAAWRPLHEEIHAFILNRGKAQAFVEPQGRVELLDMDAHGLVGDGGFNQDIAQDGAADAGVAGGRQHGDIYNADLVLPAGDREAPNGHRIAQRAVSPPHQHRPKYCRMASSVTNLAIGKSSPNACLLYCSIGTGSRSTGS